ncbi:fatty acid/sphingolipid desaturase [Macroventuria anomochaeta]|uniref:Fatty acid/sphingolipid desaturase n=1 Tax=Macroventuria anomochaeta TaxID=301207 RepID=A0ACB6RX45_9PLEO|nr:fatty acid/sphingolipid desaturase [Macroventuria anomochaeta]KAF2626501.1 fatty acid/sphingolipid desaturase [Macroventuria anomochaeta]
MVARWIAQGELIVVYEGCALQLGAWIDRHPGGRLAILHMVGRDATDEINVYHSSKALLMLERYIIGRVVEPWVNVKHPIWLLRADDGSIIGGQDGPKTASNRAGLQLQSNRGPATNHPRLHRAQLAAEAEEQEQQMCLRRTAALYQCRYSEYAVETVRCGLLFGGFVYLLRCEWYVTPSLFLGFITGDSATDTHIGASIAGLCCGMSISWWKSSHNVHHLVTNMPEHDPDSVTSTFHRRRLAWSCAAELLVPYQQYTYYPMMALARFNLYALNWLHVCSPRVTQLDAAPWMRPVELVFMASYWALFAYLLVWRTLPSWSVRIAFVAVSHMATILLHVQFTLSHCSMPTCDLGPTESFVQHQLRTTMDIECPERLDWFYGGLQFQAGLVRNFCEKTGLRYHCYGVREGNGIVLGRLGQIAQMVEMMVACQKAMAEGRDGTMQQTGT